MIEQFQFLKYIILNSNSVLYRNKLESFYISSRKKVPAPQRKETVT